GVAVADGPDPEPESVFTLDGAEINLECLTNPDSDGYFVAGVGLGMGEDGRLVGTESDAGKSVQTAINAVTSANLADLVMVAEGDNYVVLSGSGDADDAGLAVVVTKIGGQWVVTEGVFCSESMIGSGR